MNNPLILVLSQFMEPQVIANMKNCTFIKISQF